MWNRNREYEWICFFYVYWTLGVKVTQVLGHLSEVVSRTKVAQLPGKNEKAKKLGKTKLNRACDKDPEQDVHWIELKLHFCCALNKYCPFLYSKNGSSSAFLSCIRLLCCIALPCIVSCPFNWLQQQRAVSVEHVARIDYYCVASSVLLVFINNTAQVRNKDKYDTRSST